MKKNPQFEVKLHGVDITDKVKAFQVDYNIYPFGRVDLTFFDGSKKDYSLTDCEIIMHSIAWRN
ncbi:hypothetical protein [Vibrio cholerae]|uniref:hypothetical protein n=1 Tax=Vibrio cholerae TaxID=666 RepID=UPI000893EEAF|nr:hypothetical protein [Vibrio cholerae]OFJ32709.1 hypothetical protein BFX34_08915 [Vibrio cholerae]